MGQNIKFIKDMRQGLGLRKTNESKDKTIEEMNPIERIRLISKHVLNEPGLADDFKVWFESQGIIFVDRAKYANIDIFLKKIENFVPEDPTQANRYMTMVGILQEIFDE